MIYHALELKYEQPKLN
ncbi:MAG: hypothetical protein ACQZ3M_03105 [cyanobacterium endosymbiont of Rhopalodia fuxianensis]